MILDERMRALQYGRLFNSVPEADLAVLAESMTVETFGKGDIVCVQGDPADRIFVVNTGSFDVKVAGSTDPPASLGPGELFGEYGLFDQGIRTATIVARTPGTLLTLDYDRFRAFLLQFPEAMLAVLSATVGQLLAYQQRLGSSG